MYKHKQEELLHERLRREATDLSKDLTVGVRINEREMDSSGPNLLTVYRAQQKKIPTDKRIVHDLINVEFPNENLLMKHHTDYSAIEVKYLKDAELTLYVISFKDLETKETLKFSFLTTYNLLTATGTNFSAKQHTTIHNLNFILCEMIELAAKIKSETDSYMVGTGS